MDTHTKKKVYVGLSGGVDSSVSAALLIDQGYDVTGVFIKTWYPDFVECDWKKERRDAMKICAHLGIPFIELDLEDTYKREVADYMIHEYKRGRTPNPDVMCNKNVKFGGFLTWALAQGADYVATGHYAQVKTETGNQKSEEVYVLAPGVDTNKDQSYFLWTLTSDQLSHILFPVGHLTKPEVRKIAEEKGLLTATKKDSQGICFLGHIDIKDFLSHFVETEEGNILNEKGEVIGIHEGALFFTIGQRHGFEVTKKSPDAGAFYIISKDLEKNTITVTDSAHAQESLHNGKLLELEQVNWTILPEEGREYEARIRYRQILQKCFVKKENGIWKIEFNEAQKSVAVGQSAVLYDRDICLGGGVISQIKK